MVRMQLHWIALDDTDRSVAILREGPGEGDWSPRVLLVPIEPAQAKAIARALGDGTSHRPSTHQLVAAAAESLGGRIVRVTLRSSVAEPSDPSLRPTSDDLVEQDPSGASSRLSSTKGRARGYLAEVHVEREGQVFALPAEPGDALALALMADAPILVSWDLVERRTVLLQEDDAGEFDRFRRLMRGIEAS